MSSIHLRKSLASLFHFTSSNTNNNYGREGNQRFLITCISFEDDEDLDINDQNQYFQQSIQEQRTQQELHQHNRFFNFHAQHNQSAQSAKKIFEKATITFSEAMAALYVRIEFLKLNNTPN